MGEYIIRIATKQDANAIHEIIHHVGINPLGLDWRHFLVAVSRDDRLIGCGQIKSHSDGSRELASIAVYEWARNQGVARAIIEELLRNDTNRPLYLMCRSRLESLYNKFGFKKIGIEKMPPFFKRIHRAERIFNAKAQAEDRLSIMRLD